MFKKIVSAAVQCLLLASFARVVGHAASPAAERTKFRPGYRFRAVYPSVENPQYAARQEEAKSSDLLESFIPYLNASIVLSKDIDISLTECGVANAFYSPDTNSISFCWELIDRFFYAFAPDLKPEREKSFLESFNDAVRKAGTVGPSGMTEEEILTAQKKTWGAVAFTLYHEVGHALIDTLDLPITGREEDAADQLATLILTRGGEDGEKMAINGAAGLASLGPPRIATLFDDSPFADEHAWGPQRLFNVLCWAYGNNMARWGYMVNDGTLPEVRAKRCPGEFHRMAESWKKILSPHLKSPQAFWASVPRREAAGDVNSGVARGKAETAEAQKSTAEGEVVYDGPMHDPDTGLPPEAASAQPSGGDGDIQDVAEHISQEAKEAERRARIPLTPDEREAIESQYPGRDDVAVISMTIAMYKDDNGHFPASLDELAVDNKYLRGVPGKRYLNYDPVRGVVSIRPKRRRKQ